MFQRFIYILVTLVLVIKIAGFYPLFKIKQWDIRRNIELAIEENIFNEPLKQISIPSKNVKNLKWEREGKEFWYEGGLYDIVRSEIQDETTHFYCINDTPETQLNHEFQAFIHKKMDSSNDSDTTITDFFKKVVKIYFPSNFKPYEDIKWVMMPHKMLDFISYLDFYKSTFLQSIEPPPKQD
jgi:hypothetical protein